MYVVGDKRETRRGQSSYGTCASYVLICRRMSLTEDSMEALSSPITRRRTRRCCVVACACSAWKRRVGDQQAADTPPEHTASPLSSLDCACRGWLCWLVQARDVVSTGRVDIPPREHHRCTGVETHLRAVIPVSQRCPFRRLHRGPTRYPPVIDSTCWVGDTSRERARKPVTNKSRALVGRPAPASSLVCRW